jgi:glycosyltransferase involved in cell wall biosynthesis
MNKVLPATPQPKTSKPTVTKVLLLCDFFSSLGGTEYYNFSLAEGLRAQGIDVRIYVGEKPRLKYWSERINRQGIFYREPDTYHESFADNDIETQFIAENVEAINAWKPDIIQVHPFKKMAMAWLANEHSDKSIPMVATEWTVPTKHAAHWFEPGADKYIQRVHTYIATCQAIEAGLRDYHGYTGPIAHIPHLLKPAPQPAAQHSPETILSVGCVSRLSVEKGLDFLIGAWRKVHEAYPKATLHIYGHGPELAHLTTLRDSLGLAEVISFEGTFEPHSGIDSVAARHSIFVQPSLFESIPTSLIELMLRGRVMVASSVGGVPELINEQTGVLVQPGSTDEISTALISLLGSRPAIERLSAAAHAFSSEKYDHDAVLADITALYHSVIQNSDVHYIRNEALRSK